MLVFVADGPDLDSTHLSPSKLMTDNKHLYIGESQSKFHNWTMYSIYKMRLCTTDSCKGKLRGVVDLTI